MHGVGGEEVGDAQVAAQFSVQYAAACAVHRGGVGLADIEPRRARDPEFAQLARAVKVNVEPAWPGHVSPGRVTLQTARNGAVSLLVDKLPGSAARPLGDATGDHTIARLGLDTRLCRYSTSAATASVIVGCFQVKPSA